MILALQGPEGPGFNFLLLFLVVLAGPAILSRARVPGIIGLLIGGWAIGPHGLGLIKAGNQTVPELGQFGLLYLMFVAGLELDLNVLRVYRRNAVAFGLATFVLPFVCGVGVGYGFGFITAAAVLLGSLAASHTLITYPLLRSAGLGRNPAVATAVGATVLTDTLSLVVLAVVSGTQTGSGSMAGIVLELAAGMIAIAFFSLVVLPRAAVWVFHRLGSDRSVRFLVALISFLAAASVAHVFSIEGIVGAFFAGLGLNGLVPNEGETMHQIDFFGSAVFVPIFLVSTGLLLDPSVMFELETMKFAALLILACLGGKALAAGFAHLFLGVPRVDSGLMWVVSIPQAAATLAATTVGFQIGLFSTTVVNAVLVLILVSITASTVLVPTFVRRVSPPDAEAPALGERVVLAVHDGQPSPAAAQLAAQVAHGAGGIVQTLLVRQSGDGPIDRKPMEELADLSRREGFEGKVYLAIDRSTAHAVVHGANDLDASLVLVESDLGAADGPFAARHWEEEIAATIGAPLVLVSRGGVAISRAVVGPLETAEIGESAAAFVTRLAVAASPGHVVETADTSPEWVSTLRPGDVAFIAVPTLQMMLGLPTPPPGATLAAVPVASLGRWRPE
jgi:Kef-type K+ transport system membrane component KefB